MTSPHLPGGRADRPATGVVWTRPYGRVDRGLDGL